MNISRMSFGSLQQSPLKMHEKNGSGKCGHGECDGHGKRDGYGECGTGECDGHGKNGHDKRGSGKCGSGCSGLNKNNENEKGYGK